MILGLDLVLVKQYISETYNTIAYIKMILHYLKKKKGLLTKVL